MLKQYPSINQMALLQQGKNLILVVIDELIKETIRNFEKFDTEFLQTLVAYYHNALLMLFI